MARITYSDDQRANALAILKAEGGNLSRASAATGIGRDTIRNWAEEAQPGTVIHQSISKKATDLAALMRAEIELALGPGLDTARKLASYKDRVTGAAILLDKVQLLTGGPTARSEVRTLDESPERQRLARDAAEALVNQWKGPEPVEVN